jgi:molybdopterin-guanine dinucleotide biosynthesis protein A
MEPVAGIVLCGGCSSRMGRPKAWLPFGNELMLPRVVRLLSEVVSPVVVVAAAAGQELPSLPVNVALARDPLPDRGPLQGLAAGLAVFDCADAAYVSSCDVPLLRPAFVRRLIELRGDAQACVPQIGGRLHPLAAVYRHDVLPVAERQLAAGRLSLTNFCSLLRPRIVSAEELTNADPHLRSLRNINTPEEYAAALAAGESLD